MWIERLWSRGRWDVRPTGSLAAFAAREADLERRLHRGPAPLEVLLDDWLLFAENKVPIETINRNMHLSFAFIGEEPPRDIAHCLAWSAALRLMPYL